MVLTPVPVSLTSFSLISLANPKSANLARPLCNNIFCALMSLCVIFKSYNKQAASTISLSIGSAFFYVKFPFMTI